MKKQTGNDQCTPKGRDVMMKRIVKYGAVVLLVIICISAFENQKAEARGKKVKKVALTLGGDYILVKRHKCLKKAKRVKTKCSNKSIVQVKYLKNHKDKRLRIVAKKKGIATITVKCFYKKRRTRTVRYRIRVLEKRKAIEKAKEAFKLQNQYRNEKGVQELKWSDEIYQFCMYRMRTSGYDEHKNLGRDIKNYFGMYADFQSIIFAENMAKGSFAATAIKAWKNSSRHNLNMLDGNHVCGAIATYNGMWFAIFFDRDIDLIENWKAYHLKEIVVKRYDTVTGSAISGSTIGYYDIENRQDTLKTVRINEIEGEKIYLEVGKTYVLYERIRPTGYEKAESICITVSEDGTDTIIITSMPEIESSG